MASSFSSSSSSTTIVPQRLYGVFLSFSGPDTRDTFTSHLLAALNRQGFSTFRDDTKLQRGKDICSQLPRAISDSRVSIVIFSKNYPASGWCLDELVKIMECERDLNQIVLPIFYDVDPSDVRRQSKCYAEAFKKHEERFKGTYSMERVMRWREALTQAANLSGWDLQNVFDRDEAKLIKIVVEEVTNRLDRLYFSVAKHPVGIDSRVRALKSLLKLGLDDVRIVAIWGVGGIGKTTLAKAIFNCICNDFECTSFLADVRETCKKHGVVTLQKQLLSNILMNETYNLDNYHHGIEVIGQKLCHKKVLLVLDDVDHVQELEMLAINPDFFCKGSKIIITTRNKSALTSLQVDAFYTPGELNEDESLKLFSWNAFKSDRPKEGYLELSNEVVTYAEGLPLVLEILGSYLRHRSKVEWESGLTKIRKHPYGDIQGKLKISFDALDKKDQELVLDIAFFFIGMDKYFTVKVLEDSECFPEIGIGELARRCLVRVDQYNNLRMHNVLRDMAREIICVEAFKEPGARSRLRGHEEVLHVLRDCTGTKSIEGLSLELPELNAEHVNAVAFANMSNLRLLHLNYLCHLKGTYVTTTKKLKWLCWHRFPLPCLPADLHMENLVAIDLQNSKLKQIWKGTKILNKLRFLNLSYSNYLTKTPDFSGLKKLEKLYLNECTNLVEVHNSIGCLETLIILNMANCINLTKVPPSIFLLKSLQDLNLSGCCKLNELPRSKGTVSVFRQLLSKRQKCMPISTASIQGLSSLRKLNLGGCNLSYLPFEIGSLGSLESIHLSGNKFSSLPSSFSGLSRLRYLSLDWCDKLESLPDLHNNLKYLGGNGCVSLGYESVERQLGKVKEMMFLDCPKLDDSNFRRNIIQFYKGDSETSLILSAAAGEFPDDFPFQSIGSSLSFVVPLNVHQKIRGWIACAVVYGQTHNGLIRLEVINKTKGTKTHYPTGASECPSEHPSYLSTDSTDTRKCWSMAAPTNGRHHVDDNKGIMWLQYIALSEDGFGIESGDEMELDYFEWFDWFTEKRCGMRLIYEGDNDKTLEFIEQSVVVQ